LELRQSLSAYHLPIDAIPIVTDKKLRLTAHDKWVTIMQAKEAAHREGVPFDGIECPIAKDVLFGKGQLIQSHPGNIGMRCLLEGKYEAYNACETRHEKSCISHEIYNSIQGAGGRFLREDSLQYWVIVGKSEALNKISMAFRDLRKRLSQGKTVLHRPPAEGESNKEKGRLSLRTKRAPPDMSASSKAFLEVVEEQLRPAAKKRYGVILDP
jgi:hypothetical protein